MAKIQEYGPQAEASGPVGGVSPNTEFVTQYGRGIESFGNDVQQAGDVLVRRQTMADISEAGATLAQKRADLTEDIQSNVDKGTLNIDEFKNDLQNWANEEGDKYTTPGGKNYFNRQYNRLYQSMFTKALHGQRQIVINNTTADVQRQLNENERAIEQDPTQLKDVLQDNSVHLKDLVDAGALPASKLAQAENEAGTKMVYAATRGYYRTDPESAKAFLDSGHVDQYLNSDQRKQLYNEIQTAKNAKDVESERISSVQKRLQDATDRKWWNDSFNKVLSGGISTQDVLKAPLSAAMKQHVIGYIHQVSKEDLKTDPQVRQETYDRILDPNAKEPITDVRQLVREAADGRIAPGDIPMFQKAIEQTPEGQVKKQNYALLNDAAKSKLTKYMGLTDSDGYQRLALFTNELHQQEDALVKDGKSLNDFYNPNKPNSAWSLIDKYAGKPVDILKAQAQLQTGQTQRPALISNPSGTPQSSGVLSPTTTQPAPTGQVERKTKDGKTALFDAKTKKFIGFK